MLLLLHCSYMYVHQLQVLALVVAVSFEFNLLLQSANEEIYLRDLWHRFCIGNFMYFVSIYIAKCTSAQV